MSRFVNQFFMENFVSDSPDFPKAKCKEIADPSIFFPDSKVEYLKNYQQVNAICGSCAHQVQCALYAINYEMEYGTWGAVPAEHRKRILKSKKFGFLHRKGRSARNLLEQGWTMDEIAKRYRSTPENVQIWIDMFNKVEVKQEELSVYFQ